MIQSNELRIGNWVNQRNRKHVGKSLYPFEIRVQDLKYLEGKTSFKERVEGIPLSPEILEKCGFKDIWGGITEQNLLLTEDIFISKDFSIRYSYWDGDDERGGIEYKEIVKIKYLHQLQNLYFALTGGELKINL